MSNNAINTRQVYTGVKILSGVKDQLDLLKKLKGEKSISLLLKKLVEKEFSVMDSKDRLYLSKIDESGKLYLDKSEVVKYSFDTRTLDTVNFILQSKEFSEDTKKKVISEVIDNLLFRDEEDKDFTEYIYESMLSEWVIWALNSFRW